MKIYKVFFALFITLSIVACGSSGSVTKTSNQNYEATDPSSIEVFMTTSPSKAYTEIGTVSVLRVKSKVFPANRNPEEILADMKKQASSIGGHAIINYRESGEANMTGTVIRYNQ